MTSLFPKRKLSLIVHENKRDHNNKLCPIKPGPGPRRHSLNISSTKLIKKKKKKPLKKTSLHPHANGASRTKHTHTLRCVFYANELKL